MHVFHHHLVTSKARLVEARYLGKLGFELVGRYGWLGDRSRWFEPNEDTFLAALERASDLSLKIQDHPEKQTFISTEAGYRLEMHPPRDWIDEALARAGELRVDEIHPRGADPGAKAGVLAQIFGLPREDGNVRVGKTLVRFLPDGPSGRPELVGEVLS